MGTISTGIFIHEVKKNYIDIHTPCGSNKPIMQKIHYYLKTAYENRANNTFPFWNNKKPHTFQVRRWGRRPRPPWGDARAASPDHTKDVRGLIGAGGETAPGAAAVRKEEEPGEKKNLFFKNGFFFCGKPLEFCECLKETWRVIAEIYITNLIFDF